MQLVDARLKCGCRGSERIDHNSVGIRFLSHEPCEAHQDWDGRWRHLCEADHLAWRDEAAVARLRRADALMEAWLKANEAAIAVGQPRISPVEFFWENADPEDKAEALADIEEDGD